MSTINIKIFLLGLIIGIITFSFIVWFFKESILTNLIGFGASKKNSQVVIQQNLKLFQGEKVIGVIYKGSILEYTLHVDKIDHYNLDLTFEPSMYPELYDEVKNIFKEDAKISGTITNLLIEE